MILLITPSARGQECADALNAATGRETDWARSLQEATTRLREQTYSNLIGLHVNAGSLLTDQRLDEYARAVAGRSVGPPEADGRFG